MYYGQTFVNKNPPRINEEGSNHRSPQTYSRLGRKKMWGETTVYSQLFGINISSMFLLRTTNKTGEFLAHPIGLHHSHHRRFAYLSPLITGLFASSPFSRGSHPQERGIPHSKDSTNKESH